MFKILRRVVDVRENEVRALLWASAYFFCLLGSWYILRPIREEMGVRQDVEKLAYLYLGTLAVTFIATPLFAILVNRFTRERFIPIVYRALAAMILLFAVLLWTAPETWKISIYRGFYVWSSMFTLFAVSVFWGYLADIMADAQAKRLFGFIAAGGTAGGLAGSFLTGEIVREVGISNLLIIAAVMLEIGLFCFRKLSIAARDGGFSKQEDAAEVREVRASAVSGIRKVFASRYLMILCVYMLLFTMGSTFIYFQQSEIIAKTSTNPEERTRLFAEIDKYVNGITLILQGLAVGRLIGWLGLPAVIVILPIVSCGGFVGLASAPAVAILFWFQVSRRASEFSFAKPSRDLLFTVVTREEKYSSKTFIDTFIYRGGDALTAWGRDALKKEYPPAVLAWIAAVLSFLWIFISIWLGREQERRARSGVAKLS